MPFLDHLPYRIHYQQHGEGHRDNYPLLLIHGAASSFEHNYGTWGWPDRLVAQGFRVIGFDLRGHGKSDQPRDAAAYGVATLAGDALAVLDALDVEQAAIAGYSLGSAVTLALLRNHPDRFSRAAMIATGDGLIGISPYTLDEVGADLATALQCESFPEHLPSHIATYWHFARDSGGDRLAIAAAAQASHTPWTAGELAMIQTPTLVISGEMDPVLGRAPQLAEALPQGEYLEIPGADHFMLAAMEEVINATGAFLKPHA